MSPCRSHCARETAVTYIPGHANRSRADASGCTRRGRLRRTRPLLLLCWLLGRWLLGLPRTEEVARADVRATEQLDERRGGSQRDIHQARCDGVEEVDQLRIEREHDLGLREARIVDDHLR